MKWGVVVGGMFACHRYYRTRDIMAAAHWFTVMSFVSCFNIFLSYQLQDFVTEYGSRKSLSIASRNEYHSNAYRAYLQTLTTTVKPLDYEVEPVLNDQQTSAFNSFIDNYSTYLKEEFGTTDKTMAEVIGAITERTQGT